MARPKGSKTAPATGAPSPSRCHACGSTDQRKHGDRRVQEYAGVDSTGAPFTHIIRQRVECTACGQHRTDTSRENRPRAAENGENAV